MQQDLYALYDKQNRRMGRDAKTIHPEQAIAKKEEKEKEKKTN